MREKQPLRIIKSHFIFIAIIARMFSCLNEKKADPWYVPVAAG